MKYGQPEKEKCNNSIYSMFNMCQWQYEYEQDCHGMYSQHNIKYRPKWKKLPIALHPVWSWERCLDNYYGISVHWTCSGWTPLQPPTAGSSFPLLTKKPMPAYKPAARWGTTYWADPMCRSVMTIDPSHRPGRRWTLSRQRPGWRRCCWSWGSSTWTSSGPLQQKWLFLIIGANCNILKST